MSATVRYEGVTFFVESCARKTKAEFIESNVDVFWLDRSAADRRAMLAEAYALIVPPKSKNKKK